MSFPNGQIPPAPADQVDDVDEDASLSDHEAQFGAGRIAPAEEEEEPEPAAAPVVAPPADAKVDDKGDDKAAAPPPAKHRAKSQQAGAADVPRINELTKKLRESERREQELEARLRAQPAPVSGAPKIDTSKPFEYAEFDDWQDKPENKGKSWGTYQNARDDARDAWREAKTAGASTATTRSDLDAARKESGEAKAAVWNERMGESQKAHPDYRDLLEAADKERGEFIPDLLRDTLLDDDSGTEDLYTLLRNPGILDGMVLETIGKPVTAQTVAITRRLLKTRLQAATTGSAGSRKNPIAPRPPNPVRTGPQKTGDEPPDDASSLAEHERAFGDKGHGRRR